MKGVRGQASGGPETCLDMCGLHKVAIQAILQQGPAHPLGSMISVFSQFGIFWCCRASINEAPGREFISWCRERIRARKNGPGVRWEFKRMPVRANEINFKSTSLMPFCRNEVERLVLFRKMKRFIRLRIQNWRQGKPARIRRRICHCLFKMALLANWLSSVSSVLRASCGS